MIACLWFTLMQMKLLMLHLFYRRLQQVQRKFFANVQNWRIYGVNFFFKFSPLQRTRFEIWWLWHGTKNCMKFKKKYKTLWHLVAQENKLKSCVWSNRRSLCLPTFLGNKLWQQWSVRLSLFLLETKLFDEKAQNSFHVSQISYFLRTERMSDWDF